MRAEAKEDFFLAYALNPRGPKTRGGMRELFMRTISLNIGMKE
jgi:hypothetical protein